MTATDGLGQVSTGRAIRKTSALGSPDGAR